MIGAIGDTAPDSWGRRLLQRAERRAAEREGRRVRTLGEADYVLGVADTVRLGALRFRRDAAEAFQKPSPDGVPPVIRLGELLASTDRLLRDEESDADLTLMLAPGSSLGGARPKASVMDAQRRLAIAKFPKPEDDYSIEAWEAIAMRLAANAGIDVLEADLVSVAGRKVLLSRRFDRSASGRIPFSLELVREVAPLFDLSAAGADAVIREVAAATRDWRRVAASPGETPAAITRMASAFEHDDLDAALSL